MEKQTLGDVLDLIRIPLEDAGRRPGFAESLPRRMLYHYLMLAEKSVIYTDEEGKRRRFGVEDPDYITISCVPLCLVDKQECPDRPKTGCVWHRTASVLPEHIGPIRRVFLNDRDFGQGSWDSAKNKRNSYLAFHDETTFYHREYREGKHLFAEFPEDFEISSVSIEIAPVNKFDAMQYDCEAGIVCSILDEPYSLDPRYSQQVINLTVQMILNLTRGGLRADVKSDLMDGSIEQDV